MRVLHVITALGVGGAERMLLKLLGARALAGVEQRVVAMLPSGALAGALRATGARVDELDFLGGVPVLAAGAQLMARAREFAPDVIQGWLYHGNLGASLARTALPGRAPLIWSIRQSLPTLRGENAFARVGIVLNRMASRRPDAILFNSQTSLAQHAAFGFHMERARHLPNGFETHAFAPNANMRARWRSQWGLDPRHVAYGLFARYHPVKDHAGFLLAAKHAIAARPECRFVLAGPGVGTTNAELTGLIERHGLGPYIYLLGERHDVADLLPALDVYVSSSLHEGFSNSIGEAMSCALPCVVTDVGESGLLVGDTGRIVPPRNPEALAQAMISLASLDPGAREELGMRARARVLSNYDIEAVARQYMSLYDELTRAGAVGR